MLVLTWVGRQDGKMRLSSRGRYALRMMIDIAEYGSEKPRQLKDIAARQNISKRYLEHIVISLKNNSLIRSTSGKFGGFMLSRAPEDITVGEIIEAAIGPINIVECVMEPDICISNEFCECRKLYSRVNGRIRETFNETTLAEMIDENRDCHVPEDRVQRKTSCPLAKERTAR